MSALSRIRNNIGLVAVVIFVALAAFILTDFLSGITSIFNSPPPAAEVAGQEISNQEFERRVSEAMQQNRNLGQASNEVLNGQIRQDVWNSIVQEKVYEQEFKKVGIVITEDELIDMMAGNNIPDVVVQSFFGQDPRNPDMAFIRNGLKQLNQTEGGIQALKSLEDYLLRSRPQERYQTMINKSFVGSSSYAQQLYEQQNKRVDLSYVSVPYGSIADSTITVSTSEINDYISDHPARYEQDEASFVRYVSFDVNPSAEDSASARDRISRIITSFKNIDDDSVYTQGRVRVPYSSTLREVSAVPRFIQDDVVNADVKTVFGPYQDGAYYKIYKLSGTGVAEKPSASIDHILITATGRTAADTTAARSKAANVLRQARGGADFAELAKENSNDPSTSNSGGKLGWYAKSRFSDDFNAAIEKAAVGSIIGPLKGPGGFHVVKITNKTNKTFNIAEIEEEITPSSNTKKKVYLDANQFVKKAKDAKDINEAATAQGLRAIETSALTAKTYNIPGMNGGRNVAVWGLNSDVGDISSVIKINQDEKYVVAQVVRKYDEGLKSADDVATREAVRVLVRNQKKAAQIKAKLTSLGQDLNAIKTGYGTGAVLGQSTGVSFDNPNVPNIGNEPKVAGIAMSLAENAVSAPIEGKNGVYIIQATKITAPAAADATTLANLKRSGAQSGGFALSNKIGQGLLKIADVKDRRADYEWLVQRQGSR